MGNGNEHTGEGASSRGERSETADGRCNPCYRKGSGSHRENNLRCGGRHSRDGIHDFVALERTKAKAQAPRLRSWAICSIMNRGVFLGYVEIKVCALGRRAPWLGSRPPLNVAARPFAVR
jgi:hypothetical protein